MSIKAVIFDCDGVLIDSEIIGCRVAADFFTQAGYPLDTMTYIREFAGQSHKQIIARIHADAGHTIVMDDKARKVAQYEAFRKELKAVPGVPEMLAALPYPRGVASGSSLERLGLTLKLVNLEQALAPHIHSADEVAAGKPAPDIFLKVAGQLGFAPAECVVVGDSHHDMHGAKAAGMVPFGFTGASHGGPWLETRLKEAGAHLVFQDITKLPELIQQYNQSCR